MLFLFVVNLLFVGGSV